MLEMSSVPTQHVGPRQRRVDVESGWVVGRTVASGLAAMAAGSPVAPPPTISPGGSSLPGREGGGLVKLLHCDHYLGLDGSLGSRAYLATRGL